MDSSDDTGADEKETECIENQGGWIRRSCSRVLDVEVYLSIAAKKGQKVHKLCIGCSILRNSAFINKNKL